MEPHRDCNAEATALAHELPEGCRNLLYDGQDLSCKDRDRTCRQGAHPEHFEKMFRRCGSAARRAPVGERLQRRKCGPICAGGHRAIVACSTHAAADPEVPA